VTGDTNLGHQPDLRRFDLAIILVRPPRLVVDQIVPLIPEVVAAFATASKHAVTTVGRPKAPRRKLATAGQPDSPGEASGAPRRPTSKKPSA
jgi:hypothetical protein